MQKQGSLKKTLFMISILTILFSLSGCNRRIGHGVVLWSDQEELSTGAITDILSESKIRKTYIVQVKGTKDRFELPLWRVKFFEKSAAAEEFAATFEEWQPIYAFTTKASLPMRERADASSERVYKLREGQEIKVLNRGDMVEIGRFKGYWYEVLTGDGTIGYCFDAYLTVYSLNDKQEMIVQNEKDTSDPQLDNFFNSEWRPEWFQDMLSRGQIDLKLFRPDYGLFLDKEAGTITLNTPERAVQSTFDSVTRIGANRYDFAGTSFRITINSENFISVQYKHEGLEISEAFISLKADINELIANESERREGLLAAFMNRGPEMSSQAYGTILFENSGRFTWIDKSSLISQQILTVSSGNSGRVSFDIFPQTRIESHYDAVMTFHFDSGETADFLYSIRDAGASLLYVHPRYIEKRIVTSDQFFDPIQMYFTFPDKSQFSEGKESDSESDDAEILAADAEESAVREG
ncbi:MAG: hypothetical protein B6241_13285 [Spirochaetaceae bacterium 4572_59]|nr:MAG: hypothetical protein B6241_13285 [Spirochaetaceae bacterium 4572_59]